MKPITLRAHEVRRLQTAGEVLVVRRIKWPVYGAWAGGKRRVMTEREAEKITAEIAGGLLHRPVCPHGMPRERRWVREVWNHTERSMDEARAITEDIMSGTAVNYRATFVDDMVAAGMSRADATESETWETWLPSIQMPRWASRYVVEIAEVQAKQVQAITEAEAIAAGVQLGGPIGHIPSYRAGPYAYHFAQLWDYMNGPDSWSANPWVWFVLARRVEA